MKRFSRLNTATLRAAMLSVLLLFVVVFMISCNSGSDAGSSDNQASGLGTVSGTVVDCESLDTLHNVKVSIGSITTTTDSEGNYLLSGIQAGNHTVTAERSEYETIEETVEVGSGRETVLDIVMESTRDEWLTPGAKYNWQIEAVQADGTITAGPVWNFTTEDNRQAFPQLVISKGISAETAQDIAQVHIDKNSHGFDRTISSVTPLSGRNGETIAYLFTLSPAGYVIVPASRVDTLPPVIVHSFETSLLKDRGSAASLINIVKADVQMRLAAHQEGVKATSAFLQKNRKAWDSYLSGEKPRTDTAKLKYGPLLYTPTWNQSAPYNDLCPMDPELNEQCVTGCVATAYSQVFYYWGNPKGITFTTADNYTTMTRKIKIYAPDASFSNLYSGGYKLNEIRAKVSFAAGVISRMDYTAESSSAYTMSVGKAISNEYGFGPTKVIHFSEDETFNSTPLINNLKKTPYGCPVVMAIRRMVNGESQGGHAIVCDGYNDNDETFHLNLGWGGSTDGWYSLPDGLPSRFNFVAGYVCNITPSTKAQAGSRSLRSPIPQNPYPDNGETGISTDECFDWDDCDGAVSYNCYLWKDNEQKPVTPTFKGLPYAAVAPEFLEE